MFKVKGILVAIMTVAYAGHISAMQTPQQENEKNILAEMDKENAHKMMLFKHGMMQGMGPGEKGAIEDASKHVASNLHALHKFTAPTPEEWTEQMKQNINEGSYRARFIDIKGIKYITYNVVKNPGPLEEIRVDVDKDGIIKFIEFAYKRAPGDDRSGPGLEIDFKAMEINPKAISFNKEAIIHTENLEDGEKAFLLKLNAEFIINPK